MWDFETPSITTRLRGTTYLQLALRSATCDLHSGLFGGSARNALQAMVEFLAGMHDADGRVTLPGFYEDVPPLPPDLARQWDAIGFDEQAMLRTFGLSTPAGERGFNGLERLWSRPTLEIHGALGRLHGRRPQDRHPGGGACQDFVSYRAGQSPGTRSRRCGATSMPIPRPMPGSR